MRLPSGRLNSCSSMPKPTPVEEQERLRFLLKSTPTVLPRFPYRHASAGCALNTMLQVTVDSELL